MPVPIRIYSLDQVEGLIAGSVKVLPAICKYGDVHVPSENTVYRLAMPRFVIGEVYSLMTFNPYISNPTKIYLDENNSIVVAKEETAQPPLKPVCVRLTDILLYSYGTHDYERYAYLAHYAGFSNVEQLDNFLLDKVWNRKRIGYSDRYFWMLFVERVKRNGNL